MTDVSPYWAEFRRRRLEIAKELWIQDHYFQECLNNPENQELEEGGYIERAHKITFQEMRSCLLPTLKKARKSKALPIGD